MIVDSSALIAIVFREPDHETLLTKLAGADWAGIATPTLVETGIVLSARLRRDARPVVSLLLQEAGVEEVPFGAGHWREAVGAFLRYGKGRHPAALNFGDCISYATAKLASVPLLCVGEDFSKTDLALA
jgi:ribonuclease VapC